MAPADITQMEISNPRRILVLGLPSSGIPSLLHSLTGSTPEPSTTGSLAGLSHSWTLTNRYYTAELPIWIDELPHPIEPWVSEFQSLSAREVILAVGAWVYVFTKPLDEEGFGVIKQTMKGIQKIIEKGVGYSWDGQCVAVAMKQSTSPALEKEKEDWQDVCMEYGFEYVDGEEKGRDEYGEVLGMERVREVLEANDWSGGGGDGDTGDYDEFLDEDDEGDFLGTFAAEEAEMNMEFFGMKNAIHGVGDNGEDAENDDHELQVEEMERMMSKLQAVRDMGAGMPEAERKKFAAKAVNDIMKEL